MPKNKELFITGFALFSMFFGAGNLLLPPLLGYQATTQWHWVTIGFMITAVVIPILGILAHARLQGTMFDFAKKVSPVFSLLYCIIIYIISVAVPSPRTASAVHEIAIFPNFGTSALLTSSIYFALVLVFVLNRSKILNIIGKFLTPLIVLILLAVIVIGIAMPHEALQASTLTVPFVDGLQEGYQTFDAIGAVVIGGVIIISLNLKGHTSFEAKKKLIINAGIVAGLGLLTMYAGLIALGAFFSNEIAIDTTLSNDMQRATLLRTISLSTLGNIGTAFLSVLVTLACFTTAVGITTGTADYFKGLCNDRQDVYQIVAVVACVIGVAIGQMDFHTIIVIAIPILKCAYPITIVLIFLNVLPKKIATSLVFKTVVYCTLFFSIPDAIAFFVKDSELLNSFRSLVPFGNYDFGWVLPAILAFGVATLLQKRIVHE